VSGATGPGRGLALLRGRVALIVAALVVIVVGLVALTLGRRPPPTFAPTDLAPREVGGERIGPVRVTLDASDTRRWVFFDFSRGAPVDAPTPDGWDLAFRRFDIAVNGGPGLAGRGGAVDLGRVAFDSVPEVPERGYLGARTARDSVSPALERWYDYGFTSHLLTPKPRVYAVRTADGRYALFRLLSYYCPGPTPGCISFEYIYRGDGERRMR
jgi:hypothetical protein